MWPKLGVITLLLQIERYSMHCFLHDNILHSQSLTNKFQFLKSVVLHHAHVPACTIVTVSVTRLCTDALTANIRFSISLKIILIGTAEIPRNFLDINTIIGVVGEIWIATKPSCTASTSFMTTTYVPSIDFTASTTTASS